VRQASPISACFTLTRQYDGGSGQRFSIESTTPKTGVASLEAFLRRKKEFKDIGWRLQALCLILGLNQNMSSPKKLDKEKDVRYID
jgi:hypothetical protein